MEKLKKNWDSVDINSEQLLDDELLGSIYLFPDNLSSRGTASTGVPPSNTVYPKPEVNRNVNKFK